MRLTIVGSTNLSREQHREVNSIIRQAIERHKPDAIVSGGADGVDRAAEVWGKISGLPVIVVKPARQEWSAFKPRNLIVAELGDHLVRIVKSDSKTYGSGWTRDRHAELGKTHEEHVI